MFQTWNLDANDRKLLASYYTKFEAYVKPNSNEIYNRYKFQTRVQEEGETFEQFATQLQILVKDCAYPEQDKMVRDRILIGIKNQLIREKLIKVCSELTLAKAMEIARVHELSESQAKSMSNEDHKVNALGKNKP